MSFIYVSKKDSTALLLLDRSTTNVIDEELVDELTGVFAALERDNEVTSVMLTNTNNKIFSLGFNLPHLLELKREGFRSFYENFNRLCLKLYTFPKPLIVAIDGFAVAGGCVLTLCCDLRFIASGRKLMGLNEAKLGLPVPWPAEVILRRLIGDHKAEKMLFEGALYSPHALKEIGLVDRICDPSELREQAVKKATKLGANYGPAFEMMKLNARRAIADRITDDLETHNRRVYDIWFSDDVRKRLKEAAKKF